jgi:hypothetical protein
MMKTKTNYRNLLLALLLTLAGLAGAMAPQRAAAENYGFYIGGVRVTSENIKAINSKNFPAIKSGTVTYDPNTRKLTLNNATMESDGDGIDCRSSDTLTIELIGKNTVTVKGNHPYGIFKRQGKLHIMGSGKLTVASPNYVSIYTLDASLLIDGCTIDAIGGIGTKADLTIKKATINAKATESRYALLARKLIFDGCGVTIPSGTSIGKTTLANTTYEVILKDGKRCEEVSIAPGGTNPEPVPTPIGEFYIGGVRVTSANVNAINSKNFPAIKSGKVTYAPNIRKLTLNNATMESDDDGIDCRLPDTLTIELIGKNTVTVKGNHPYGIFKHQGKLHIMGSGKLTVASPNYASIYTLDASLLIDGCTIDAIGGIGTKADLTIKKATMRVKASKNRYALLARKLIFDGCGVITPSGTSIRKTTLANTTYEVILKNSRPCAKVIIAPGGTVPPSDPE